MKKRTIALLAACLTFAGVMLGGVGAQGDSCPAPRPDTYINTGDMASDIVAHAKSQVGYSEGSSGWNAFGNSYGDPTGAWCAFFVRWCADMADVPESIFPRSRYGRVSDFWETSDNATLVFHPVNDFSSPYTPKKGDLVIYRSNYTYYDTKSKKIYSYPTANTIDCQLGSKKTSSGGTRFLSHIGIVSENCANASNNGSYVSWSTFKMIDGNWGGGVTQRSECFRNITGFVSINYPQTTRQQPAGTAAGTWPVLRSGSSGFSVAMLQYLLNARSGAGLAVDGRFGTLTVSALKRFQTEHGLACDGVAGKNTWEALTNYTQSTGSGNKNAVFAIQYALRWRFGVSLGIDGGFGPITKAAVVKLQKHFGLGVDGIVGPKTWKALICGEAANLG